MTICIFFAGNYYTDECLTRIGGRPGGTISFYQIHTYSHSGAFNPTSPFKVITKKLIRAYTKN